MRISYTYQNYPNCPRATKYSMRVESTAAYGGIILSLFTIGTVILFPLYTFSFFGEFNWGKFLGAIACSIVVAIMDIYHFVIRPNNTKCKIKIILAQDGNRNVPPEVLQQYCDTLRKENRKANKVEFTCFFLFFIVGLFDVVALIAAIKGAYFLFHKLGGLFLLLGGIVVAGILSYLIWRLRNGLLSKIITKSALVSKK